MSLVGLLSRHTHRCQVCDTFYQAACDCEEEAFNFLCPACMLDELGALDNGDEGD